MNTTGEVPSGANRLIHETSPYLLQHAHNPVDWYPSGDDALARARELDRLILLSIGYSACHWCHVMERESFEDPSIAALMNEHFVNIKVDREERPDIDEIYMAATVALNQGQGGWPMTVFLTPECEPVFAGTYFPPTDRFGRPGFPSLLTMIARAWKDDRASLRNQAQLLRQHLQATTRIGPRTLVSEVELQGAVEHYARVFDAQFGGFGPAPKFPPATSVSLLLRLYHRFNDEHALEMARRTLNAMALGGMYDQIGGGFARYATDRKWLVPHFEKMLYDNALLAGAYLEAHQATGSSLYRRIACETLDYVLREMTSPEGGFFSSTDADSEGQEGKFFVWRPEEIVDILGEERGRWFNTFYDITQEGNWEGVSIPNCPRPMEDVARDLGLNARELDSALDAARELVYQARVTRVPPGLDDKILTAWNGLMINALAEGYRITGLQSYLNAACRAAAFLLDTLMDEHGCLLRTYRNGKAHLAAYLEDYAYLSEALITLYEVGGDVRHLRAAERLLGVVLAQFADLDSGAFYHTAKDHERLIVRYREGSDGATPSANAVAALALARISYHLDREDLRDAARQAIEAYGQMIVQHPRAFAKSLHVVDFLLDGPVELALVGVPDSPDTKGLYRAVAAHYLPNRIQAQGDPRAPESWAGLQLLAGKTLVDGHAALYVCRNFACERPIIHPTEVSAAVGRRSQRDPGIAAGPAAAD